MRWLPKRRGHRLEDQGVSVGIAEVRCQVEGHRVADCNGGVRIAADATGALLGGSTGSSPQVAVMRRGQCGEEKAR